MTKDQLDKLNTIRAEIYKRIKPLAEGHLNYDMGSSSEQDKDWEVDVYGDEDNTTVVNITDNTFVVIRKWNEYGIQVSLIHNGIAQFVEEFDLED